MNCSLCNKRLYIRLSITVCSTCIKELRVPYILFFLSHHNNPIQPILIQDCIQRHTNYLNDKYAYLSPPIIDNSKRGVKRKFLPDYFSIPTTKTQYVQ